jgi:hypothetical protein
MAKRFFNNVANFKYFGTAVTDQNFIHVEITSRINSENALYQLDVSRQLSKNVKFKIYKTIILPVVFYGCETWSLDINPLLPKKISHLKKIHEHRLFKN